MAPAVTSLLYTSLLCAYLSPSTTAVNKMIGPWLVALSVHGTSGLRTQIEKQLVVVAGDCIWATRVEAERGPRLCPAHGMVLVTACACDQMCISASILAFALALVKWKRRGKPPSPSACTTTAVLPAPLLAMLGGRSTVVHVRLLPVANVHHH